MLSAMLYLERHLTWYTQLVAIMVTPAPATAPDIAPDG